MFNYTFATNKFRGNPQYVSPLFYLCFNPLWVAGALGWRRLATLSERLTCIRSAWTWKRQLAMWSIMLESGRLYDWGQSGQCELAFGRNWHELNWWPYMILIIPASGRECLSCKKSSRHMCEFFEEPYAALDEAWGEGRIMVTRLHYHLTREQYFAKKWEEYWQKCLSTWYSR